MRLGRLPAMGQSTWGLGLCLLLLGLLFVHLAGARDHATGAPHHDEAIAMLAAKALQGDYGALKAGERAPFGEVVPARVWHRFTRQLAPIGFTQVRDDMLQGDIHPPLAFWVMSGWAALIDEGGYTGQRQLAVAWVLITAAVLLWALHAAGLSGGWLVLLSALFLASNAAMATAGWVRQYGLLALIFLLTLLLAQRLLRRWSGLAAISLGLMALVGMLTHFEYFTMTAALHLVLCWGLVRVQGWRAACWLGGVYVAAAGLFVLLMPGIFHVHGTAGTLQGQYAGSMIGALAAVPQAWLPVPSATPPVFAAASGVLLLALPPWLVGWWRWASDDAPLPARLWQGRLLLAAGLGVGAVQCVLTASGIFPPTGTAPYHMVALVIVTLLATAHRMPEVLAGRYARRVSVALVAGLVGLASLQWAYVRHMQRLQPNLHTHHAGQGHDLVIIDNLARGFVLSVTDVLAPDQPVLVAPPARVSGLLQSGALEGYPDILYLPMHETVASGKPQVLTAARATGRVVTEQPVVFRGLYEAISLQRRP